VPHLFRITITTIMVAGWLPSKLQMDRKEKITTVYSPHCQPANLQAL
jgi:hypothetical protein